MKIFPCISFYKNVLQISSNEVVRYKFGGCTHCRYLLKCKHKTDYSNANNSTQYYPVSRSVCCFTDVIYSMLCKPRYTTKTKCISTDGRKPLFIKQAVWEMTNLFCFRKGFRILQFKCIEQTKNRPSLMHVMATGMCVNCPGGGIDLPCRMCLYSLLHSFHFVVSWELYCLLSHSLYFNFSLSQPRSFQ